MFASEAFPELADPQRSVHERRNKPKWAKQRNQAFSPGLGMSIKVGMYTALLPPAGTQRQLDTWGAGDIPLASTHQPW